jgi:hypothetical protein
MKTKWTYEKCKEVALLCESRSEFQKKYRGAYKFALRNNILNDVCNHMLYKQKPNGYWTYERCKKESKKYIKKSHFKINNSGAYVSSRKNGWLDEFFPVIS